MTELEKNTTQKRKIPYDFSKMGAMYDKYFSTGFYDQRYPRENKKTLSTILSELSNIKINDVKKSPKHILDFGCGDGRYLLPMLKNTDDIFTAYDPSKAALNILTERVHMTGGIDRVAVFHGDIETLSNHIEQKGKADIIILMFGVLSHVGRREKRVQLLKKLSSFLRDENSRVILSVPNRFRRFIKKDGKNISATSGEIGSIIYKRHYNGEELKFFYHLYTPDSFVRELNEAGLKIYRTDLESFFPESWVTKSYLIGLLDRITCKFLPVRQGYGMLAVAGRNSTQTK